MPHFSPTGHDMFLCQFCGRDCDSGKETSVWIEGRGNKCQRCVAKDTATAAQRPIESHPPKLEGFEGFIFVKNPKTNGERKFRISRDYVFLIEGKKETAIARINESQHVVPLLVSKKVTEEHRKLAEILNNPIRFISSHGLIYSHQKEEKAKAPISLYEHCRKESGGLEGVALDRYVNRYYGHG